MYPIIKMEINRKGKKSGFLKKRHRKNACAYYFSSTERLRDQEEIIRKLFSRKHTEDQRSETKSVSVQSWK